MPPWLDDAIRESCDRPFIPCSTIVHILLRCSQKATSLYACVVLSLLRSISRFESIITKQMSSLDNISIWIPRGRRLDLDSSSVPRTGIRVLPPAKGTLYTEYGVTNFGHEHH